MGFSPFVGHFSPSWAKNDLQKKTDDPRVVGGRRSVVDRQPKMNFREVVLDA
jgi:hypothetical protein